MRQLITKSDTLLNVPRDRYLMHSQILALKCFYHLTWMEQSRVGFFSDFLEICMVFLSSMHPLESPFSKIMAFFLQLLLLYYTHNGIPRPQIYFTALAGCFGVGKFQLFVDLILIGKVLRKLHRGATGQQFLMSVAFVTAVWYYIPVEIIFFIVLFYEVVDTCIKEELNLYQICYLVSASFLLGYLRCDIDEDCLRQPMECLKRPFLPPESNITLLRRQIMQNMGHF